MTINTRCHPNRT